MARKGRRPQPPGRSRSSSRDSRDSSINSADDYNSDDGLLSSKSESGGGPGPRKGRRPVAYQPDLVNVFAGSLGQDNDVGGGVSRGILPQASGLGGGGRGIQSTKSWISNNSFDSILDDISRAKKATAGEGGGSGSGRKGVTRESSREVLCSPDLVNQFAGTFGAGDSGGTSGGQSPQAALSDDSTSRSSQSRGSSHSRGGSSRAERRRISSDDLIPEGSVPVVTKESPLNSDDPEEGCAATAESSAYYSSDDAEIIDGPPPAMIPQDPLMPMNDIQYGYDDNNNDDMSDMNHSYAISVLKQCSTEIIHHHHDDPYKDVDVEDYHQNVDHILDAGLHKKKRTQQHKSLKKCTRRCFLMLIATCFLAIVVATSVVVGSNKNKSKNHGNTPSSGEATASSSSSSYSSVSAAAVYLDPIPEHLATSCQMASMDKLLEMQCLQGCKKAFCCTLSGDYDLSCAQDNEDLCLQYHEVCQGVFKDEGGNGGGAVDAAIKDTDDAEKAVDGDENPEDAEANAAEAAIDEIEKVFHEDDSTEEDSATTIEEVQAQANAEAAIDEVDKLLDEEDYDKEEDAQAQADEVRDAIQVIDDTEKAAEDGDDEDPGEAIAEAKDAIKKIDEVLGEDSSEGGSDEEDYDKEEDAQAQAQADEVRNAIQVIDDTEKAAEDGDDEDPGEAIAEAKDAIKKIDEVLGGYSSEGGSDEVDSAETNVEEDPIEDEDVIKMIESEEATEVEEPAGAVDAEDHDDTVAGAEDTIKKIDDVEGGSSEEDHEEPVDAVDAEDHDDTVAGAEDTIKKIDDVEGGSSEEDHEEPVDAVGAAIGLIDDVENAEKDEDPDDAVADTEDAIKKIDEIFDQGNRKERDSTVDLAIDMLEDGEKAQDGEDPDDAVAGAKDTIEKIDKVIGGGKRKQRRDNAVAEAAAVIDMIEEIERGEADEEPAGN